MKSFSLNLWLFSFLVVGSLNAQITFNACNSLIEDQNYTFNQKNIDATGRNVFVTDPVTGDQNCGGIGICEMQVAWNDTGSRWEILADDGNGTFSNTFVLYYNMESSTPNPPSLLFGTWVENTAVTNSLCVDGIAMLSGDVQDTTLGTSDSELEAELTIYPNPASNILNISTGTIAIKRLFISDINGRIVVNRFDSFESIDVSKLSKGMYFLKIELVDFQITKKIVIK